MIVLKQLITIPLTWKTYYNFVFVNNNADINKYKNVNGHAACFCRDQRLDKPTWREKSMKINQRVPCNP